MKTLTLDKVGKIVERVVDIKEYRPSVPELREYGYILFFEGNATLPSFKIWLDGNNMLYLKDLSGNIIGKGQIFTFEVNKYSYKKCNKMTKLEFSERVRRINSLLNLK